MIRARGGTNAPGKSVVHPVLTASPGRKKRKRDTPWFAVIAGAMVMIMFLYSATGLYAVTQFGQPIVQTPERMQPKHPQPVQQVVIQSLDDHYDEILRNIRKTFKKRYEVVRDGRHLMDGDKILQHGLLTFGSVEYTARRILEASYEKRPFVMAFSGYSVTVGRGNYFKQSFPFVVEEILKEPFQQLFGIDITVRNSAIGGVSSFPYGFCLDHFLGADPDVIAWDYSMNEPGKDSSILEAFLRQATAQLSKRPMVILVDTKAQRLQTLDEYTKRGWLKDAIAIGRKDVVLTKSTEDNIVGSKEIPTPDEDLPEGFQNWNKFGAPKQCPGQSSWHPKMQEHAMMGWIIAMYFVEAMEKAVKMKQDLMIDGSRPPPLSKAMPKLGKPISNGLPQNDPEVTDMLYGHPSKDEWIMKQVSCRTSFLPATDKTKTLSSVVVSGLVHSDLDIMSDRTDQHYKDGWVLDLSKVERYTKKKVESCGGLGYIDRKDAIYGIPESGTIRLWLPFEGPSHDHHDHDGADTNAKHWFDDFVVCEANDKRDEHSCKWNRDAEFVVGGVTVDSDKIHEFKRAAEYLKRPVCVNVGVPEGAVLTPLGEVRTTDGGDLTNAEKARFGPFQDDVLGMVVDVTVKPDSGVTRKKGACNLAHVVWEQH